MVVSLVTKLRRHVPPRSVNTEDLSQIDMYNNPPVFEIGMSFAFSPSSEGIEWSEDAAVGFLKQFEEDFPNREVIIQQEFRVEADQKNKIQRGDVSLPNVSEVNARSNDGYEVLGVVKNTLTCHQIRRSEKDYPRYKPVAERAFNCLLRYMKHWKPARVKFISLRYLDIVSIPEIGPFDLDRYFNLGIKFPDEFGAINNFECRFTFPDKQENTRLDVFLRNLGRRHDDNTYKIQVYWNCIKDNINTCSIEDIRTEMDGLHTYVCECFEASFTDKCKQLFEPTSKLNEGKVV